MHVIAQAIRTPALPKVLDKFTGPLIVRFVGWMYYAPINEATFPLRFHFGDTKWLVETRSHGHTLNAVS